MKFCFLHSFLVILVTIYQNAFCEIETKLTSNNTKENIVSSYWGIICPLTLIAMSSSEIAKSEIMSALGMKNDSLLLSPCISVHNNVMSMIRKDLILINDMYIEQNLAIHPNASSNFSHYDVHIHKVGFKQYPKTSISYINKRISEISLRRIRDVLRPKDIDNTTALVIVNAAHFKGSWEWDFRKGDTKMMEFMKADEKKVKVPMMHQKEEFACGDVAQLHARVIDMRFQTFGSSMTVVLPHDKDGIGGILSKLANDPLLLVKVKNKLPFKVVNLFLPKFQIKTHDMDLNDVLQKIGIKEVFNKDNCSLTELGDNIHLSKVKQKIFLQFDEVGTGKMGNRPYAYNRRVLYSKDYNERPPAQDYHIEFKANKPFYFIINFGMNRSLFEGVYYASEVP